MPESLHLNVSILKSARMVLELRPALSWDMFWRLVRMKAEFDSCSTSNEFGGVKSGLFQGIINLHSRHLL